MPPSSDCMKSMEEARKTLEAAGFPAMIADDGTLTSFFALDEEGRAFAYTSECLEDGRPQSHAGFKGVVDSLEKLECSEKLRFLEALLTIPTRYKVAIGVDRDLILAYFPPGDPSSAYTYIGSTFALATNLAGWMLEALDKLARGEEIPEFRPE